MMDETLKSSSIEVESADTNDRLPSTIVSFSAVSVESGSKPPNSLPSGASVTVSRSSHSLLEAAGDSGPGPSSKAHRKRGKR